MRASWPWLGWASLVMVQPELGLPLNWRHPARAIRTVALVPTNRPEARLPRWWRCRWWSQRALALIHRPKVRAAPWYAARVRVSAALPWLASTSPQVHAVLALHATLKNGYDKNTTNPRCDSQTLHKQAFQNEKTIPLYPYPQAFV